MDPGHPINYKRNQPCQNLLSWTSSPQMMRSRQLWRFLQPHLKELCELYLSADDIVGVYNVLDLLTHAVECRAEQLKVVCLHKARQMHAVVSRTESWTELAPELRELVTNIHADAR